MAAESVQLPMSMYLPEGYEPRFAYPLLIWLHADGANEQQLQSVMPQISKRNYLGIGFRGTSDDGRSAPGAFHWQYGDEKLVEFAEEIDETLDEVRRYMRINTQRIYLAGLDGGARMALELLLNFPERYHGAVALGGAIPSTDGFARRFRTLSSRRVLLGYRKRDSSIKLRKNVYSAAKLEQTGVRVETRLYESEDDAHPQMLRDADRWLMAEFASTFS